MYLSLVARVTKSSTDIGGWTILVDWKAPLTAVGLMVCLRGLLMTMLMSEGLYLSSGGFLLGSHPEGALIFTIPALLAPVDSIFFTNLNLSDKNKMHLSPLLFFSPRQVSPLLQGWSESFWLREMFHHNVLNYTNTRRVSLSIIWKFLYLRFKLKLYQRSVTTLSVYCPTARQVEKDIKQTELFVVWQLSICYIVISYHHCDARSSSW